MKFFLFLALASLTNFAFADCQSNLQNGTKKYNEANGSHRINEGDLIAVQYEIDDQIDSGEYDHNVICNSVTSISKNLKATGDKINLSIQLLTLAKNECATSREIEESIFYSERANNLYISYTEMEKDIKTYTRIFCE